MSGKHAFAAIIAITAAGVLGVSWWAAVVGGCLLALVSIGNYSLAYSDRAGGVFASTAMIMAALLNAAATSSAAFAAGRLIGWVWGV